MAETMSIHQSLIFNPAIALDKFAKQTIRESQGEFEDYVILSAVTVAGAVFFVAGAVETAARAALFLVAKLAHFCCPSDSEWGEYIETDYLVPLFSHLTITYNATLVAGKNAFVLVPDEVSGEVNGFVQEVKEEECVKDTSKAVSNFFFGSVIPAHFDGFDQVTE